MNQNPARCVNAFRAPASQAAGRNIAGMIAAGDLDEILRFAAQSIDQQTAFAPVTISTDTAAIARQTGSEYSDQVVEKTSGLKQHVR